LFNVRYDLGFDLMPVDRQVNHLFWWSFLGLDWMPAWLVFRHWFDARYHFSTGFAL